MMGRGDMHLLRGQTGMFAICMVMTALAMVVFVRVCHNATLSSAAAIGQIFAAAFLLAAITSPPPIILMIASRRAPVLKVAAFILWMMLCCLVGVWAALAPA